MTITLILTTITSAIFSFWIGRRAGFQSGRQEGYGTGYRDGRISCFRNKKAELTQRLASKKEPNGQNSEEEAVQWMG